MLILHKFRCSALVVSCGLSKTLEMKLLLGHWQLDAHDKMEGLIMALLLVIVSGKVGTPASLLIR